MTRILPQTLIAVLLTSLLATSPHADDVSALAKYDQLALMFDAESRDIRSKAQTDWETTCLRLGDGINEAAREQACRDMCGSLTSSQSRELALFLLRQLERIGRSESVSTLVEQLRNEDSEVADAARRALQNNRSADATEALLSLLSEAGEESFKIKIINSLGYRREPDAISALAGVLETKTPAMRIAAGKALSRTGTDEAVNAVFDAWKATSVSHRNDLAHAVIAGTTNLSPNSAANILNEVYANTSSRSIRAAALQRLLMADENKAAQRISTAIQSENRLEQQVAIGHVKYLSESNIATLIEDLSATTSTSVRATLIAALASRRSKAVLPLAEKACESDDVILKTAALEALGHVGTVDNIELLWEHVGSPEFGKTASKSLEMILDNRVDDVLLRRLSTLAADSERGQLISMLSARRTPGLAQIVVDSGDLISEDTETRKRANGILNRLGTEAHISALINAMTQVPSTESDKLAKTVVSICNRIPSQEGKAAPVVDLYATSSSAQRPYLLAVAGRVGGATAKDFIGSKINSRASEEKDAAITAICNWPDDSVADALLIIAKSGETESQRIRALRAIARVVVLPSSQHALDEQLLILKQAMKLATRDDERRLIIDRAKAIGASDTVQFVRSYLTSEMLGQQAEKSLVHLARIAELRQADPQIRLDLQQIVATSKDQKLRERAKQYLLDY